MQRTPRTALQRRLDIALIALAVFTAVAVMAAMYWDSRPAQSAGQSSYTPPAIITAEPVTFAAVGDSITAANSESIAAGKAGNMSWAYYVDQGNVDLVGGWARGGATTAEMAAGVKEVDADVLVILAGANDIGQNKPFDETANSLETIVGKTGINNVIVSSAPPRDEDPGASTAFNEQLESFVDEQEWTWVDASAVLRDGDVFAEGLTEDGIHPTQEGSKALAKELRKAIIAAT